MNYLEPIVALSRVAVAIAAVGAFIVACKGLRVWKEELAGKSDYVLAKDLLTRSYTFRENLEFVRTPIFLPHELPVDLAMEFDPRITKDEKARQKAIMYENAYIKRWAPASESMIGLQKNSIEAEVLWGRKRKILLRRSSTADGN